MIYESGKEEEADESDIVTCSLVGIGCLPKPAGNK